MIKVKEITSKRLMEEFTDALLHGDKAQSVYNNSKPAKLLLEKGKTVINEVGRYLQNLKSLLAGCEEVERNIVEHGWIILLCDIKDKEKIDTGKVIFAGNFDLWVEWAVNFRA